MATPYNTVPHRGRVFQNWKTQLFLSFFSFKSESRWSGRSGEGPQPSEQFGPEDVFTEIPIQSSYVKGVLNLEPNPFMKRLPHRHNRDIPKPTSEPELSTKVKYLMSNFVSNHRLS